MGGQALVHYTRPDWGENDLTYCGQNALVRGFAIDLGQVAEGYHRHRPHCLKCAKIALMESVARTRDLQNRYTDETRRRAAKARGNL